MKIEMGIGWVKEGDKLVSATSGQYTAEIEQLRAALYEVTTNGAWTEGEQRGDWKISKEVYETARDALS